MLDTDMLDTDIVDTQDVVGMGNAHWAWRIWCFSAVNIFGGLNIFQGSILFRCKYFSVVNIFQG